MPDPPQPPAPHARLSRARQWLASLGPGLVAGGADNDPAGVTAFSLVGAGSGFSYLWLLALTTPMETAVQTICGVIGAETGRGLATLMRARFGLLVSLSLTVAFLVGNFAALIADTLIVSDSLSMLTHLPAWYFPVLIIFLAWHLLVFRNFRRIIGSLALLNVSFLVYVAAAIFLRPNWGHVLAGLLWPPWGFSRGLGHHAFLADAVALVGARFSPYMFFWQASAETEKYTDVRTRGQTVADIATGMVVSNLVGFFIIVTTGASLFTRGISVATVRQAASALLPVAGAAGYLLYALGILGSGLIAIPVLAATSSYALSETLDWRRGLARRPWQARRFYMFLTAVLLVVAGLSYLPWNSIQIAFWSQIFWGVLAPILLILIFFLERRSGRRRIEISTAQRVWLSAAIVLSVAMALLLFVT
ncbi:MAG: NRAMP family divalent metal transporter [Terriglobales bacterium]